MNEVYYRIYLTRDNLFTIVCMQDFDEIDYDQCRFLTDHGTGEKLIFPTEESATVYLNDNVKDDFICAEFKHFPSFELFRR